MHASEGVVVPPCAAWHAMRANSVPGSHWHAGSSRLVHDCTGMPVIFVPASSEYCRKVIKLMCPGQQSLKPATQRSGVASTAGQVLAPLLLAAVTTAPPGAKLGSQGDLKLTLDNMLHGMHPHNLADDTHTYTHTHLMLCVVHRS